MLFRDRTFIHSKVRFQLEVLNQARTLLLITPLSRKKKDATS